MKTKTMSFKKIAAAGIIKQYGVVLAIILPIMVLILFTSIGPYHFKSDVKKQVETSFLHSNVISFDQINGIQGNKLIINLNRESSLPVGTKNTAIDIPADSVLNKSILKNIISHKGPVLLYADDLALTSRMWMILSQLGCSNIFILTKDPDNENPVNQN